CEYLKAGVVAKGGPEGWPCNASGTISHALIAVVPDPLDSHLDWAFDAALESIRRAFERAGYVPDRYWLPWRPELDTLPGAAATAAALRARAPGVILFRSAEQTDLALVYLVGETPTR